MSRVNRGLRIYLSGNSGLLGSAIERHLAAAGYGEVLSRTIEEMDLTDQAAASEFLRAEKPDFVIHCAAKVGGIQANIADPVGFLTENLRMNANVICSALEAGVRHLIYIGSSCMYPRDYMNPLKEEYLLAAPLEPTNEGYALAKIAGAKLCEYCNAQYGTFYKTLIPCNLYGPGDNFKPGSSHLIPAAIDKIHTAKAGGEKQVVIWGDGTARREFLYVEDLADYICRCPERIEELPDYLNVGYGRDYTVLEYYSMAAEVIGFDGEFVLDASKPVGMTMKLLDSSRAGAYGWNPTTPPSEGMEKTYRHYLRHVVESHT
jgi:GDP-L-fucose synthase